MLMMKRLSALRQYPPRCCKRRTFTSSAANGSTPPSATSETGAVAADRVASTGVEVTTSSQRLSQGSFIWTIDSSLLYRVLGGFGFVLVTYSGFTYTFVKNEVGHLEKHVDVKIEKLEEKIDKLDEKSTRLEEKMDKMNSRLETVIVKMDERLTKVEGSKNIEDAVRADRLLWWWQRK